MKLLINGSEQAIIGPEDRPLSRVLEEVQERCLVDGETITSISVNGAPLESGGNAGGDLPVRDAGTVCIEVKSFFQLTLEGLAEAESYLPRLTNAVQRAASLLQRGNEDEGVQLIQASVEGFNWLQQLLSGIGGLKDAGQGDWLTSFETRILLDREGELRALLDRCGEVLETGDLILLADYLEYDLAPWLEGLHKEMGQLRERLEGAL